MAIIHNIEGTLKLKPALILGLRIANCGYNIFHRPGASLAKVNTFLFLNNFTILMKETPAYVN